MTSPKPSTGDEMEISRFSDMTPDELHLVVQSILRELPNEDILRINRAVLQVMFERDLAGGALDDAIDAGRVIWENKS
jgi:hypothetical protein